MSQVLRGERHVAVPLTMQCGGRNISPSADTLVWLATSDEAGQTSGGYFKNRKPRTPNPQIDDDVAVNRLWEESEKLVVKAGV